MRGIEPPCQAWEACVLPLYDTRSGPHAFNCSILPLRKTTAPPALHSGSFIQPSLARGLSLFLRVAKRGLDMDYVRFGRQRAGQFQSLNTASTLNRLAGRDGDVGARVDQFEDCLFAIGDRDENRCPKRGPVYQMRQNCLFHTPTPHVWTARPGVDRNSSSGPVGGGGHDQGCAEPFLQGPRTFHALIAPASITQPQ